MSRASQTGGQCPAAVGSEQHVGFPAFQSELLLTLLAGHPEMWQITKPKPKQDKNKTKKAQHRVKQ